MLAAIPFPNIDPAIFSIEIGGFTFALRWYALAYIAGILIGWWIAIRAVSVDRIWHRGAPLDRGDLEELLTWIVLGVILGGRLGFVLFYQPGYYLQNPLEILAIWQGGMAFHGGMLGVVIAVWLYARRHGVPLASTADILALATPPGLLLGRIANFVNGELWGRPTEAPWGVIFPDPRAQDCPGVMGDCARHPSQLYEAGLEGLVLGAVLLLLAFRYGALKTPWLMTGVFLAGYGLSRIVVEVFRQADLQFVTPDNPWGHVVGTAQYGLTMGQVLSLPMLVVGVALILWARRRI